MLDRFKAMPKWQKMVLAVLIIGVVIGGIKFNSLISDPKPGVQAANPITVQMQAADKVPWESAMLFKADLEPVEEGIVGSKISGQVVQILFAEGEMVSSGQALVVLDTQDLETQLRAEQINLSKLQTTLETVQRAYERTQALFASEAVSKTDFETAETNLKMAQANVDAEQVSIQNIQNALDNSVLRAPLSGSVAEKNVSLGQYITPGSALAKIKDVSSIQAVIQLKQSDLERVKIGQTVKLKLSQDAVDSYEGIVKTINASADTAARVFNCQILVNNTDGKLSPGIFGYIQIDNAVKPEVLTIPLQALTGTEGSYSVFTLEENTARKRSVTIGEIQNDLVEILSGLNQGDPVIITNLNALQDGDAVQVEGQGNN